MTLTATRPGMIPPAARTETAPLTVLVIDDNADSRLLLERQLTHSGYRVLSAPDGVRGLQVVLEVPLDLIVLDMNMPHRDGLETLKLIRALGCVTSVIVLTAGLNPVTRREMLELDVTDILIKPAGMKQLLAAAQEAAAARRPMRESAPAPII